MYCIHGWKFSGLFMNFSTVILLPSSESFKKGCCQLQVKVCAQSTGYLLVQDCPGKSVVRWTGRSAMTIAVDLGRKATKQTNKHYSWIQDYSWMCIEIESQPQNSDLGRLACCKFYNLNFKSSGFWKFWTFINVHRNTWPQHFGW